MILTSIIPSNILAALRTYIRNYVASLVPSPSAICITDNNGGLLTAIAGETNVNTETETKALVGSRFSQNGVGLITNGGDSTYFLVSYSITINSLSNGIFSFSISKEGTILEESTQSVKVSSGFTYTISSTFLALIQESNTIKLIAEGDNGNEFVTENLTISISKLN